jgi:phosphoenolpyruvate carboxykinase (ATP)
MDNIVMTPCVLNTATNRNLSYSVLVEHALARGEAVLADNGALVVQTGKYTGRSPGDKFIVDDATTHAKVDWGKTNQPFDNAKFDALLEKVTAYLATKETYIFDGYGGASEQYRLPISVVTEFAWHNAFAQALLLHRDEILSDDEAKKFTIIDAANFKADPAVDGTKTETFIILNFTKRIVLIGGTEYAGEIKKSVFSILNFLLPERNVFPMHCSANIGQDGSTALFFGLSGTGKTTLSADPARSLIGDDEHGWSEDGIFNFEGGCYAKTIHLSAKTEPAIWNAIHYGTVLENVVLDPTTRAIDYDSSARTENTRAAYPLRFIDNSVQPSVGGHPKTIIFLTADAFGVLPPVAKLTKEQAMYHFLSGYTSKLAGTERGITTPEATFSTLFGAPFFALPPVCYADLLGEYLDKHQADVYLLNTGWTGGPYGVGKRMNLTLTRAMVDAALSGTIKNVEYKKDSIFGLYVPEKVPGVPSEVLSARSTWSNEAEYDVAARKLAALFQENFKKFAGTSDVIRLSGPRVA